MSNDKTAGQIDRNAGARLRAMRSARGVSQSALGDALGVTFQQVQKYEKGTNRISISRLVMICDFLRCSPMDIIGKDAASAPADFADNAAEAAQMAAAWKLIGRAVHAATGKSALAASLLHEGMREASEESHAPRTH